MPPIIFSVFYVKVVFCAPELRQVCLLPVHLLPQHSVGVLQAENPQSQLVLPHLQCKAHCKNAPPVAAILSLLPCERLGISWLPGYFSWDRNREKGVKEVSSCTHLLRSQYLSSLRIPQVLCCGGAGLRPNRYPGPPSWPACWCSSL